jgi:hypothetical protein
MNDQDRDHVQTAYDHPDDSGDASGDVDSRYQDGGDASSGSDSGDARF